MASLKQCQLKQKHLNGSLYLQFVFEGRFLYNPIYIYVYCKLLIIFIMVAMPFEGLIQYITVLCFKIWLRGLDIFIIHVYK